MWWPRLVRSHFLPLRVTPLLICLWNQGSRVYRYQCTYVDKSRSHCLPVGSPFVASAAPSATVTGFPASAPTQTPSKLVGRKPALGWNSWNAYKCGTFNPLHCSPQLNNFFSDISEDKVIAAAQSFVDLGLKDAGYEYVNVDVSFPQFDISY